MIQKLWRVDHLPIPNQPKPVVNIYNIPDQEKWRLGMYVMLYKAYFVPFVCHVTIHYQEQNKQISLNACG